MSAEGTTYGDEPEEDQETRSAEHEEDETPVNKKVTDEETPLVHLCRFALDEFRVKSLVNLWLDEDCPSMDFAACVIGDEPRLAVLISKSADGILAGVPFFNAVFTALNCTCEWYEGAVEGTCVTNLERLAVVCGSSRNILRGERVALNCLSRACGVATEAAIAVKLVTDAGWKGSIAGTRKTTPGFRLVEKYALMIGGASTHRYDLSSMVILKDNHVWTSAFTIAKAMHQCRKVCGFPLKVEVECRSLIQAKDAIRAGCDIVMLDNFHPTAAKSVAAALKRDHPNVLIEVSGGVKLSNVVQFCSPHIDILSMSNLTQGYRCLDFSLKVLREGQDPTNPLVADEYLKC